MLTASTNLIGAFTAFLAPQAYVDHNIDVRSCAPYISNVVSHTTGGKAQPSTPNAVAQNDLQARLQRVRDLAPGWSGAKSLGVSKALINKVEAAVSSAAALAPFAELPAIVPCADGSLQIEWHEADGQFEMYFETDGSINSWWRDAATKAEVESDTDLEAQAMLAKWAVRDAAWHLKAVPA